MSPKIGDSLPYFQILDIVSAMNVHLFVIGSVDLDFIPRYVVPTIVVLGVTIFVSICVWEHFEILRIQKAQVSQKEVKPTESVQQESNSVPDELVADEAKPAELILEETWCAESAQLVPVGSSDWKYPSFFSCHAYDSSRLRIDTDVIHTLVGEDLKRLTEDERWFVEWYYAERKKGMTHFSTFGSLGLPDAPQAEVCKELRAMLTAPTLEDRDIF